MKNLAEIIEKLTELKRYQDLKTTLENWITVYRNPFIGEFKCFENILKKEYYHSSKKINTKDLKDDYKYFQDIMEIPYPQKRPLNKIVKEYNSLVEKYADINIEYLTKKLIETLNLELELS